MDSTASLLSPSSSCASPFSFSPLPSPRPLSSSTTSSCCCSPASSSFTFSPLPSPHPRATSAINCPRKTVTGFPDLDFSSSSSSIWNSPKQFSVLLQPAPAAKFRPPPVNVCNYASTTAEPSQKQQQWPGGRQGTASPRRTHYSLLGVSQSASPKEIRLSYHKLALQHHPDVSPLHQLDTATKLFAEINEAYATLADPQKRACYDLKLALESPATTPYPLQQQHSSPWTPSPRTHTDVSPPWTSSPRTYTDVSTGRVYPSMNSFYREWKRAHN